MLEERHSIRANLFLAGAEELAMIGSPSNAKPNLGRISVCNDAIRAVLGRSVADFTRCNSRTREMLREATIDGFSIRIRNDTHLFELLHNNLNKLSDVCHATKAERQKAEALFRNINKKLLNGFSGCEI